MNAMFPWIKPPKLGCCAMDCNKTAEWVIVHGAAPDDYTMACTTHVGDLLTDAPTHYIYPVRCCGHTSDCAVHNEPAYPNEPCTCGAKPGDLPHGSSAVAMGGG